MLRRVGLRFFSFRESRAAVHIRPPREKHPINEKMKKYSIETMMIEKNVPTGHMMNLDLLQSLDDRDSRNWLSLQVSNNVEGTPRSA